MTRRAPPASGGRRPAVIAVTATLLLLALAPGAAAAPAPQAQPDAEEPGGLMPDADVGDYPTSAYEIWYSEQGWSVGADVHPRPVLPVTPTVDTGSSVGERVTGWATEFVFGAVRMVVDATTWLITWAYSFRFAANLAEPASRLAGAYESGLIGPLGLRHLALFSAVVYAGWQLLRNRLARGVGELLVSLAVLAAAGALLANPEEAFRRGVGFAGGLSAAVLELATPGGDPAAAAGEGRAHDGFELDTAAVDPLADGLRVAFVAGPHDLLNWGRPLTGDCARARDELLATGPHGTDDNVRETMADAGCADEAAWNATPTVERLMGANLTLLAALLVLIAVGLVAITVVVAQFVGVVLVGLMPFAVTAGILPGGGRQLLWRWAAACVRCVVAVVAMAGVLTFLLVTANALLAHADGNLLERFGLLVVLGAAAILLRRKVLSSTQTLVGNLGRRVESARVGGTHGGGWMRPAAAGGLSGFGVAQASHDGEQDVRLLRHNRAVDSTNRALRRHVPGHLPARRGPEAATRAADDAMTGDKAGSSLEATDTRGGKPTSGLARGARLAANTTVNLPVAGPRAAALAAHAGGAASRAVRAKLQSSAERTRAAGREWRHGAAHPIDQYRHERAKLDSARPGRRASVPGRDKAAHGGSP